MSGLEPDVVEAWLYATLRAVPALAGVGIHNTIITPTPTDPGSSPAVVFQLQGGSTRRGLGITTVWADLVYLIKTVEQATSYRGSALLRRAIHGTLHGATATLPDGQIVSCVPETHIRYVELINGVQWRHTGHTWRVYARDEA